MGMLFILQVIYYTRIWIQSLPFPIIDLRGWTVIPRLEVFPAGPVTAPRMLL